MSNVCYSNNGIEERKFIQMARLGAPQGVDQEKLNASIRSIVSSTRLCSMASISGKGDTPVPWINNAYFSYTDHILYFLSEPHTEHVKNLIANPVIAVSIADSQQTGDDGKRGIQLSGTARLVDDGNELGAALKSFGSRFGDFGAAFPDVNALKASGMQSRFLEVTVSEIKVFDETTFGPETWITVKIER